MSQKKWSIAATAHEGGLGNAQRQIDPVLHITLRIVSQAYHLRCRVPK